MGVLPVSKKEGERKVMTSKQCSFVGSLSKKKQAHTTRAYIKDMIKSNISN